MTSRLSLVVLSILLAACGTPRMVPAPAEEPAPPAERAPPAQPVLVEDAHSYGRPEEARVTHVALDLDADFDAKVLSGASTLTVAAQPGATHVVLDTRDLTIERVTDAAGAPLSF